MTSQPIRVRLSRAKGFRLQEASIATNGLPAVNVSRPSPYGNYDGPTRADFERGLAEMSNADRVFYMNRVAELRGKNLACWCRHDQPCHADVLLELANGKDGQ